MAKNIEINIKNNDTQYEQLYPKSLSSNIYLSNDSDLTIVDYVDNHRTDDTFEVGDILCTTRKNISDKWLLCDGSIVTGYEELGNVLESMSFNEAIWTQTSEYISIIGNYWFTMINGEVFCVSNADDRGRGILIQKLNTNSGKFEEKYSTMVTNSFDFDKVYGLGGSFSTKEGVYVIYNENEILWSFDKGESWNFAFFFFGR